MYSSNNFGVRARLTRQHLHKSKGKMMQTLYHNRIKGVTFGAPQWLQPAGAYGACTHARTHVLAARPPYVGAAPPLQQELAGQGRRHRRPTTPRGCRELHGLLAGRCGAAARRPPRRALPDVAELAPELRADAATQAPNLTAPARVPAEAETG